MDNIAYLNQISSKNKPKKSALFGEKKFKIIGIVIGIITLLVILLIIFTNLPAQETDLVRRLGFRTKNLNTLIKDNQSNIKSAKLRASSTSLTAILDGMLQNIPSYYADPNSTTPDFVKNEENETYNLAVQTLNDGKITGTFDRAYARQMSFYVSILVALIDDVLAQTNNNEAAKAYFTSEKAQIEVLAPNFVEYYGV